MRLHYQITLLGIAVVLLLGLVQRALAMNEHLPLSIDGRSVVRANGSIGCLIGITNRDDASPLAKVRLMLIDGGRERFELGPIDLAPGQAILAESAASLENCAGATVFYRVSLERQGLRNEFVVSGVQGGGTTPASGIASQLVVAAVALVSAIIGGWVTHRLTLSRDREKDRTALKIKDFEERKAAFRDFLAAWGTTLVARDLAVAFQALERRVIVDSQTADHYKLTYDLLTRTAASKEDRENAVRDLQQCIRTHFTKFDP